MKRRKFIALLGGGAAAATWPIAASAQKPERMRRIAMLFGNNDPNIKVFQQRLGELGWSEGRNIHIESRYAPAGAQAQSLAKELVAMQPEVIFSMSRPTTAALQKETSTIPIVFTYVVDPIGAGFIASLPRPGGNITGIMAYEQEMVGKWLSMLKEIAPQTARVALLGDPKTHAYYDYLFRAAEAAAPSLGIAAIAARIENDPADIERVIAGLGEAANGAMVVIPESTTGVHTDLIVALAVRYHLPAIYHRSDIVRAGGLISYGIVAADHYRQAAFYVDKILRGAKPADLPVQTPTRYESALNLKTAKALGLTPPDRLLVATDEVVE